MVGFYFEPKQPHYPYEDSEDEFEIEENDEENIEEESEYDSFSNDEYDSEESVEPYEFASFADDFVPFIAKNQFKSQIRKHAPMPKKDSTQAKIAMIMNPMEMTLTKDHVKVLLHIVPKTASD